MKTKITSLVLLLILVGFNLSAQTGFQGEGIYTFKSVLQDEYVTSHGASVSTFEPTVTAAAQWLVVMNETDNTKYNIISQDKNYVWSLKLIDAYKSTDNLQDSVEALMTFPETASGSGVYYIKSEFVNTDATSAYFGRNKGVNGPNTTNLGDGYIPSNNKYWWVIDKVADLPAVGVPLVAMSAPTDATNVLPGASVILQASASAEEATIDSVEFFVDDVKVGLGVLNVDVYEYTWTAPATEDTVYITAKATSSTNQVATSDSVSVEVAVYPATVDLTWPSAATTILPNKQVTLTADATAETGDTITKVEFFDGATLLGEDTSAPFTLDVYFDDVASHSITAKVTDSESNIETSDAVELTTSLTTTIKSIYLNFESGDASTEWAWQASNDVPGATWAYEAYDVQKARSAANNVLALDFSGGTSTATRNLVNQVAGLEALPASGMVYVRLNYADDNNATAPDAGPALWSSTNTVSPGRVVANDDSTFKSLTWNKPAADMGANGSDVTIFPVCRMDPNNTPGKLFFDDIVTYYDPNSSGTDATGPVKASNVAAPTVTNDEIVLTWEEGYDAGIGIDSTYIFRTSTADTFPDLIDQVGYSAKGLPAGLDMNGNWTLLATVPLGTKTFTDNTISDGLTVNYTYAIVHKDYAYNYSEDVTVNNGLPTSVSEVALTSFNCFGTTGAIELSALPQGEQLQIFSISGAKVSGQEITSSALTVNLSQGIYLVRVAGDVQKVMVK